MRNRNFFGIVAAFIVRLIKALVAWIVNLFKTTRTGNVSERISNGRQAFYAVSAPRRANQRKNYKKGWA